MENIVLTVHLLLALGLILTVLLQRSEGGGLGIGGGGSGLTTGRASATALSKLTWTLAVGFLITSLSLTIIATQNSADDSVIDRLGIEAGEAPANEPLTPPGLGGALTPPSSSDAPAAPPAAD